MLLEINLITYNIRCKIKLSYSSSTVQDTNFESKTSSFSCKNVSRSFIACISLSHENSPKSWRPSFSSRLSKMTDELSAGIWSDDILFVLMYMEHDMICLASHPFPVNSLPQGQEYLSIVTACAVVVLLDFTFFSFAPLHLMLIKLFLFLMHLFYLREHLIVDVDICL